LGSESYIPSTSVALRNSVAFTFSAINAAVPLVLWPGCSPPATTIRPLSTAFLLQPKLLVGEGRLCLLMRKLATWHLVVISQFQAHLKWIHQLLMI